METLVGSVLRILDPAVKTTINKREMDIESFVAYAGGYIGLFCGFSLAELPEVLYFTLFYYRKLKQFIHMFHQSNKPQDNSNM